MYVLLEYLCTSCAQRTESLELRGCPPLAIKCECGGIAERTISAVRSGTVWGAAATRGPHQERPPGALDTRPLAEGMRYDDWRARNQSARRDEVRRNLGVDPKQFSYSK